MTRRKRRAPAPKIPTVSKTVGGSPAWCMDCLEQVDLVAFRNARIAGRYPIVHACGRVLMADPS